jgi:preprotein translocase subunit SecE
LAEKETKPGFIVRVQNGVRNYFRETVGELRKVNWPSRQEATNLTIIVLIVTTFMAILLGGADFIFSRLFALIFA